MNAVPVADQNCSNRGDDRSQKRSAALHLNVNLVLFQLPENAKNYNQEANNNQSDLVSTYINLIT